MKTRAETSSTSQQQRDRGSRVHGSRSAKAVVGWLKRRRPLRRADDKRSRRSVNPRASSKSRQTDLRAGLMAGFRHILVPIDFSTESTRALKTAANLWREEGGNLLLVHVVGPIYELRDYGYGPVQRRLPNEGMMRHARQRLQGLGRRYGGGKSKWRCLVLSGTAPRQILKAAEEFKAELIVMPTRGLSHAPPTEVGSTAERVVRHAPCPVLVLPTNAQKRTK